MNYQGLDTEQERTECSDIYEILWHSVVFKSIIECVFPNLYDIPNKREDRENFLSEPDNTNKILKYFENEEMWYLFEEILLENFVKHKDALDVVESQKNMIWFAIKAIKEYIKNKKNTNKINSNLSFSKNTENVTDWLKRKFLEIIESQYEQNEKILNTWQLPCPIAVDIKWNQVLNVEDEWQIKRIDGIDKDLAKVNGIYIYVETRTPVIIEDRYIITDLLWWNKVSLRNIKSNFVKDVFLNTNFEIIKDDEWFEITDYSSHIIKKFWWINYYNRTILSKWWRIIDKYIDENNQTLRDKKWRTITSIYKGNANYYVATVIDGWRDKKVYLDEELNEIVWLKKLGCVIVNAL